MLNRRALVAVAMALAAQGVAVTVAADPVTPKYSQQGTGRRYDAKRSLFGGSGGMFREGGRRARRGWSNRKVQRMAAKRRNKARHRARRS